jgi:tetratricopeptide (TPR) repeat protein
MRRSSRFIKLGAFGEPRTLRKAIEDKHKLRQALKSANEAPPSRLPSYRLDRIIARHSIALEKADDPLRRYKRAWAYLYKGDFTTAIAEFTQVIDARPDAANAYYGRGWAYLNNVDYKRAIVDLDQAIRLKPDFSYAYNDRGLAHMAMGDKKKALADIDRAIQLNPDYLDAYYNRALVYSSKPETRELAVRDLNKVLELSDDEELLEWAEQQLESLRPRQGL